MVTKVASVLYEWAPGYSFRGTNATKAGKELERLRENNDGELTPGEVVKSAKPKRSPLHDAFEWNDAKAARQARKITADNMIRNCRIVEQVNGHETVRAYVYTRVPMKDGGKRGFYTTPAIISDNEQMYNETLKRARGQLKSFRDRFKFIAELTSVFEAIDKLPE